MHKQRWVEGHSKSFEKIASSKPCVEKVERFPRWAKQHAVCAAPKEQLLLGVPQRDEGSSVCRVDMFVRDEERLPTIEVVCKHYLNKALLIDRESFVGIIYVPKRGPRTAP